MPALTSTLRCVYMSIVNTILMHLWSRTYMSAFVPSTLQLLHVYTSIVNTMPCRQLPVCINVSIGFNRSRHHVCTLTTTCMSMHIYNKSLSCVHIHQSLMYLHACIAFDRCMCVFVNRQHKPYASMVTTYMSAFVPSNLQLMHVYTSIVNRLQPKSLSCVYIDNNLYVYAHLKQKSVLRACPPKPNVRTYLHCLRPLHVCIC